MDTPSSYSLCRKSLVRLKSKFTTFANCIQLFFRALTSIIFVFHSSYLVADSSERSFDNINISEGLPSNQINDIFQQSNGLIWIATENGAVSFDGESFNHFRYSPGDSFHISNNYVTDIEEDSKGNIWVATEDGLNKVSPQGINKIYKKNAQGLDINVSWFTAIYSDNQSRLWIGTNEALFQYSSQTDSFNKVLIENSESSTLQVETIYQHPNGAVYVGTIEGLFEVDSKNLTGRFVESEPGVPLYNKTVNAIYEAGPSSIWLGTHDDGLNEYNFEDHTLKPFTYRNKHFDISDSTITDIIKDSNNRLWVSHLNNGISLIDVEEKQVENVRYQAFNSNGLPSNSINRIYIDQSGIVWFATTGGVSSLSPFRLASRIYRNKADKTGLSDDSIFTLFYDGKQTLWSGGDSGLNALDLNSRSLTSYPLLNAQGEKYSRQTVWHIQQADETHLWITTEKGLLLFDISTGLSESLTKDIKELSDELYTILPLDKDSVWLTGFRDVGLTLFSRERGIVKRFLSKPDSPYLQGGNFTMQKLIASGGDIWMATTCGVIRVDPLTESVRYYPISKDGSSIRATGISEDENNNIWVTTQGAGLAKFSVGEQDVSIEYFQSESGLQENELMSLSTSEDTIWLASFNKLIGFDKATGKAKQYSSLLKEKNLIFMEAASVLIGERLFLGGNRGLFEIDVSELKSNNYQPNIIITKLRMDNEISNSFTSVTNDKNLIVDYDKNDIEFHFAALDYNNPESNYYQFKLEGHDEAWSTPNNDNSIRYTNIPPGEYVFVVRGSNSDGVWSDKSARISFSVKTPWWQYVIMVLIVAVVLVGVFFSLDKRRQWKFLYARAHTDSLTGLANRFSFNQKLETEVLNTTNSFALMLIDLDGFKDVNDTYGHQVGDLLLGKVSTRLNECCRQNDVIARLGGDEFAVILRDKNLNSCLVSIAERIRAALCKDFNLGDKKVVISSSIGVAIFPEDGASDNELLIHADAAMYSAKQRGRNNVVFYNGELNALLNHRVKLRTHLRDALSHNEMHVHYQPKVDLLTRKTTGFEALLRWKNKEEGWISPAEFIPEAENNGQIISIGLWILEQACQQMSVWEKMFNLPDDFRVSVNISPIQLMQQSFVESVKKTLNDFKVDPCRIELEITESVLIQSRSHCHSVITSLQEIGVSIALDDFGVGFSSLSYLTKFPINTLKIDRSFITELSTNRQNQVILRHIFSLAEELKIRVVIEGVETQEQIEILFNLKGYVIQGYYFSKPLAKDSARSYLGQDLNDTTTLQQLN